MKKNVFPAFFLLSPSFPPILSSPSLHWPLGEALSVLQGPTDIHTDVNDAAGRGALPLLRSRSRHSSSYQFPPFLILATFALVPSYWAIRQREKSQLARGGNQTSFSCPFNTGINFLQG